MHRVHVSKALQGGQRGDGLHKPRTTVSSETRYGTWCLARAFAHLFDVLEPVPGRLPGIFESWHLSRPPHGHLLDMALISSCGWRCCCRCRGRCRFRCHCCRCLLLLWRLRLGGSGTLYVSGDEETAARYGGGAAGRCVCVGCTSIRRGGDRARAREASRERAGGNSPPPLALLSDEKIYVNTTAVLAPLTSQRLYSCTSTLVRI